MSWAAVIVGGSAIIGGVVSSEISANAASDAADTQAQAGRDANQLQWNMYQQNRQDLAPYRAVGRQGLSQLGNLALNYDNMPRFDSSQYPAFDPRDYALPSPLQGSEWGGQSGWGGPNQGAQWGGQSGWGGPNQGAWGNQGQGLGTWGADASQGLQMSGAGSPGQAGGDLQVDAQGHVIAPTKPEPGSGQSNVVSGVQGDLPAKGQDGGSWARDPQSGQWQFQPWQDTGHTADGGVGGQGQQQPLADQGRAGGNMAWQRGGGGQAGASPTAPLDPRQYAYNAPAPLSAQQYGYTPTTALDASQYRYTAPQALDPSGFAFKPPSGQQVLQQDPGYQFRLQQGMQALDRQGAAGGLRLSGAQLKAAQQYSQGEASQEYDAAYNRALGQNQLNYGRAYQHNADTFQRGAYQDQTNYGRAYQQNQDTFQRDYLGNQTNYGRALSENQQGYERGLTSNQLAYSRAYSQNQDLYNRLLQTNDIAYGRAYQHNQDQYGRALTGYQLDLARRQQQYNELAGLAGFGANATNVGVQAGQNTSQYIGNTLQGIGNAQAAARIGQANAWGGALQGAGQAGNQYLNYTLLSQALNRNQNPYGPTSTAEEANAAVQRYRDIYGNAGDGTIY
jgi:hypothetical protein